jgi:hypothetical protein
MTIVRFDDSLPALAEAITATLGREALRTGTVLRDATGRLAFFAASPLDVDTVNRVTSALRIALGAYARPDRVFADCDAPGAAAVRTDPSAIWVPVHDLRVRLVDRRLAGGDWLRTPLPPVRTPVRFVFASLKGGVGRSTALSVTAAHLATERGKRVLVIDLDMEAPGLGAMLLTPDTLPEFGVIDALVENGISGLDNGFLADLVGPSALALRGRVDVIPAFGRRSAQNPGEVLAKLARAYIEDIAEDGAVATILDQIRALLEHFSDPQRYDVILIDARAGLHETTASAILGLGAEVFLFGLDEEQTFQGYTAMFAHLARLAAGDLAEWTQRLTLVHGKAAIDASEREHFVLRCRDLFSVFSPGGAQSQQTEEVLMPEGQFDAVPWDDSVTDEEALPPDWSNREPIVVLQNDQYVRFDPLRRRDLLTERIYGATFGELLRRIETAMDSSTRTEVR